VTISTLSLGQRLRTDAGFLSRSLIPGSPLYELALTISMELRGISLVTERGFLQEGSIKTTDFRGGLPGGHMRNQQALK
jgi:hypothetical protein